MQRVFLFLLVVVMLMALTSCAGAGEPQQEEQQQEESQDEMPDTMEVVLAYEKAEEAFYWFDVSTMPTDISAVMEADGLQYCKVDHDTIKTYADLENYLHSLFTGDIVDGLLASGGNLYRDFDGALYAVPASRGTDIFKGEQLLHVGIENDVKFRCTVEVELLDEDDLDTVTDYEFHDFFYELIDGQWVFTNFYLFR